MTEARLVIARAVSIVGHPVVLIFAAAMIAASAQGASSSQLRFIGGATGALAIVGLGFSWLQVRRGRWAHIDASAKAERASLNGFLAVLLFASAVAVRLGGKPIEMTIALAIAGGLVIIAIVTSRWVKISLHTGFAAFATAIVWPVMPAVFVGCLLTMAVIWSRLTLRRHVRADVIAGLSSGAAAGVAFQVCLS